MDKYAVFDHLMDSFQCVGKLNHADVTVGDDSWVITGYPSPSFNVIRFGTKNNELINQLKAQNIPFICLPSKNIEKEFESFAQSYGLDKADFFTASYKKLEDFAYNHKPDFQISKVSTTDELKIFDKISSVAFMHPKGLAFDFFKDVMADAEIHLFLVCENDLPAGCAMISFVNNQAGLYWDGVLPEFRMKGVGTALVEYRMNYAKELGYKDIISQNNTTSLNLYKRLGFEQKGGLPLYIQL